MGKTSEVLLLSGLPGSGKTRLTEWLGPRWKCLRWDEGERWSQEERHAFLTAVQERDDSGLRAIAEQSPGGFVLEWGFHVDDLQNVAAMIDREFYKAWYFWGDREAAFAAWRQRHRDASPEQETSCHQQFDLLAKHWETIRQVYGERRMLKTIRLVGGKPKHMPPHKIARKLGLWTAN